MRSRKTAAGFQFIREDSRVLPIRSTSSNAIVIWPHRHKQAAGLARVPNSARNWGLLHIQSPGLLVGGSRKVRSCAPSLPSEPKDRAADEFSRNSSSALARRGCGYSQITCSAVDPSPSAFWTYSAQGLKCASRGVSSTVGPCTASDWKRLREVYSGA